MLNNPINHFNVNELRQVSLKAYMLRNLLPTHLLESGRELIKGEGVYYSRAFDETKSIVHSHLLAYLSTQYFLQLKNLRLLPNGLQIACY